ncbi:uncharacterized protein LOC142639764 [Castanea sativa]|uniref:uncharacterized protein LOC142639764 n=1 Tax=Castanea sativa TaxID=21020 RepID=UPI003F650D6E
MSRFAPHLVSTEALRVKKFRNGLEFKIRQRLTTSRVEDYKTLVTLAEAVEEDLKERTRIKAALEQNKGKTVKFNQPWKGKPSHNSFKKNTNKYPPRTVEKCAHCGRPHSGECRAANNTCFRCGKPGHFIRDCPNNSNKGNSTVGSGQKRPMVQGRVFSLTEQDALAAPDVVSGTLDICSKAAHVLFDSDSSHSFISPAFADMLQMSPELLDCELWVSTPSSVILCARWVYRSCVIDIAGRDLVADLILLNMHDFDAILGMDWLSTHHAVVECFEKRVIFHIPGQSEFYFEGDRKVKPLSIISALQARNMLKKGCSGFLAYMINSEATDEKLEDIPIVKEFPDVFPEELPGSL